MILKHESHLPLDGMRFSSTDGNSRKPFLAYQTGFLTGFSAVFTSARKKISSYTHWFKMTLVL